MTYTIIGAGGIGGAISAYLAGNGADVTVVVKNAYREALRTNGLTLQTEQRVIRAPSIKAFGIQDDLPKSDVVFVCVKGYSLVDTIPVITKASHERTIVIPILNALTAGQTLKQHLPHQPVAEGNVYCSAFVESPGVIRQASPFFKVFFGATSGSTAPPAKLRQIAVDLEQSGATASVAADIEADLFKKFAFISPFACTGCYFDVKMEALQAEGKERQMFISLIAELTAIAQAKRLRLDVDLLEAGLNIVRTFAPGVTSSMHKDMAAGRPMETQQLVFDVIDMAEKLNVPVPTYQEVARRLRQAGQLA